LGLKENLAFKESKDLKDLQEKEAFKDLLENKVELDLKESLDFKVFKENGAQWDYKEIMDRLDLWVQLDQKD
jgi:hypothetical protein